MLLAALVLAAACANLGGLYAARASDRTREIAIRVALGSSRSRIAVSRLLESTALAVIGGALGCVLARAALNTLTNYANSEPQLVRYCSGTAERSRSFTFFAGTPA
jgi:ABC-type lipoprotein release transport system permease subunit